MENTIYGLFQETINKYKDNVAIIENKRTNFIRSRETSCSSIRYVLLTFL